MNVKKLHYFCEICKDMNLTYTAKRLYVTQQSLSYVIRTLEQELKCTLFIRTASGVDLTEEGKYFYRRCSHILQELDDTCQTLRQASSNSGGNLRISLSPCFYNMLLHALPDSCGVSAVVYTYCSDFYCLEHLQSHQADATLLPYLPSEAGFCSTLLGHIPISLILPQHHPLARCASVPMSELSQEPLFLPQLYQPIYEALFARYPTLPTAFRRTLSLPSPLSAIHKCAQGQGVVLMDQQALTNCIVPLPAVRALPLAEPLYVPLYCVSAQKQHSPPLQSFIDRIQMALEGSESIP